MRCTNLPFHNEVPEHAKELGGFRGLGGLVKHETDFPVGILHLGVRLHELLNLSTGVVIEAVQCGQGIS